MNCPCKCYMTRIIDVRKHSDLRAAILETAVVLARGGLVAFPTDTVYGLGAHPLMENAVKKIYEVKGRPEEKALPLLLADNSQLELTAREISGAARRLAERFFPGALTLVLFKSDAIPDWVTGGDKKVALRVPDHNVPRALARALGFPIIGTSANRSGFPAACDALEVMEQIGNDIDLLLDGGPCPGGTPSTVLDITIMPPKIVREGTVSWQEIMLVVDSRE